MVILTNVLAYGLNWIISFITGISEEEVTDYSDKPENRLAQDRKQDNREYFFPFMKATPVA